MNKSLQQKNTRYLLVWLPWVLLAGTFIFYILMNEHAHHMQEQQLKLKQENVWNAFLLNPEVRAFHIRGEYELEKGVPLPKELMNKRRDTAVYYPGEKEWVRFGILTKPYSYKGEPFQLTTYISSKEITHLIIKVLFAEAFIFILLLIAIVIINRKSSRVLWQPFYDTLKKIKEYDIIKNKAIQWTGTTGIEEFDQLNQVTETLIRNVNQAYSNQKQFVENASHELQTPLAIIRSKVELMIDNPALTEDTARLLTDITDANERLSQMNKNLLLLAKIDNNQFSERSSIHLSDITEKLLSYYEEYYDGDSPVIRKKIKPGIFVPANASLIEILINNLIRNSVVHNLPGGWVDIQLNDHELVIENTGYPIPGDTEQLFERFKKGREESKTTGLGLSLVKQICDLYRYTLHYHHTEGLHRIRVIFGNGGLQNSSQIDP